VQDDEMCRRLMPIPGVGPVVALTYRVTVDVPALTSSRATTTASLTEECSFSTVSISPNSTLYPRIFT
jgi:transposase